MRNSGWSVVEGFSGRRSSCSHRSCFIVLRAACCYVLADQLDLYSQFTHAYSIIILFCFGLTDKDEEPNLRLLATATAPREKRKLTFRKGGRTPRGMRSRPDNQQQPSTSSAEFVTHDDIGCGVVRVAGLVRDSLPSYLVKEQITNDEYQEILRVLSPEMSLDALQAAWKDCQTEFGFMVITTLRWWTSPLAFFELLEALYELPENPPRQMLFPRFTSWTSDARKAWKQAICRFIKFWATYTFDFADEALYGAFLRFQQKLQTEEVLHHYGLNIVSSTVLGSMEHAPPVLCPPTHSPAKAICTLSLHPKSKFGDPLVRTITGSELKTLAEQITALEWDAFVALSPDDIRKQTLSQHDSHTDPSSSQLKLARVISLGNQLRTWAASQVLHGKTSEDRAEIINAVVQLCLHLKSLHNYASLMSIHGAFSHAAIGRLKMSFAGLPRATAKDLSSLDVLLSPLNNHEAYRKHLAKSMAVGHVCIPYLAVLLKDAMSIEHKAKTMTQEGHVDVHKLHSLSVALDQLVRKNQAPVVNVDVPLLISLKHTLLNDTRWSDAHLYERSLMCEPKEQPASPALSLSNPETPRDAWKARQWSRSRLTVLRRSRRNDETQSSQTSLDRQEGDTGSTQSFNASSLLQDLSALGLPDVFAEIRAKFDELAKTVLLELAQQAGISSASENPDTEAPASPQPVFLRIHSRPSTPSSTDMVTPTKAVHDEPPMMAQDGNVSSSLARIAAQRKESVLNDTQHEYVSMETPDLLAAMAAEDASSSCPSRAITPIVVVQAPSTPDVKYKLEQLSDSHDGLCRDKHLSRTNSGHSFSRLLDDSLCGDITMTKEQYQRVRNTLLPSLPPFQNADTNDDKNLDRTDFAYLLEKAYFAVSERQPSAHRSLSRAASVSDLSVGGARKVKSSLKHGSRAISTSSLSSSLGPQDYFGPSPTKVADISRHIKDGSNYQHEITRLKHDIETLQEQNNELQRELAAISQLPEDIEPFFTFDMLATIGKEEKANALASKEDSLHMVMRLLPSVVGFHHATRQAIRVLAEFGTRHQYGPNRTINVSSLDEFHLLVYGYCEVYLKETEVQPEITSTRRFSVDLGEKVFSVGSGSSFIPSPSKSWTLVTLAPTLVFTLPGKLVHQVLRFSASQQPTPMTVKDAEQIIIGFGKEESKLKARSTQKQQRRPQQSTIVRAIHKIPDGVSDATNNFAALQVGQRQDLLEQQHQQQSYEQGLPASARHSDKTAYEAQLEGRRYLELRREVHSHARLSSSSSSSPSWSRSHSLTAGGSEHVRVREQSRFSSARQQSTPLMSSPLDMGQTATFAPVPDIRTHPAEMGIVTSSGSFMPLSESGDDDELWTDV
eukprot:m.214692 g.214692  ORF g.214692 m.214692 type:complete len:1350 (+) comp16966_c0_seq5:453-4502(+)